MRLEDRPRNHLRICTVTGYPESCPAWKYHPTKDISRSHAHVLLFSALAFAAPAWGQSPPLLFDFSRVQHKPGEVTTPDKQKVPAGTVELVDGQFGKACRFSFVAATGPQFFTAWVNPRRIGTSTKASASGSRATVPRAAADWSSSTVMTTPCGSAIASRSSPPSGSRSPCPGATGARIGRAAGGRETRLRPSRFRNVWFGKWFYWREYPACSFTIERMALEKHIDRDATDYTPQQPGLPRVLAKLKAREPVTIVTMGDSLSDKRHWANREKLWSEELVKKLKTTYGSEVTLVNPAIGGTTLSQNVILIPRWLAGHLARPGDHLVRRQRLGQQCPGTRYEEYLELAVDRVRRVTEGRNSIGTSVMKVFSHCMWAAMR